MTLGKALTVPPCAFGIDGSLGYEKCWWQPRSSLIGQQVLFSASMIPNWVKPPNHDWTPVGAAAAIDVEVINGNLEAVHIPTLGLQFQDLLIAVLKDKFGPPASTETTVKQNAFGTTFQVATLNWQINNVKILFDGGDLDQGMVTLWTEKSLYWQKAAARLRKNF
jgi:hypothetical protein